MRGEHGKSGKTLPFPEYRTVECISWDEYKIPFAHFLYFVAHPEVDIAFKDNECLVVVSLSVNSIPTITDDSDIRGHVLALNNEDPLNFVVSSVSSDSTICLRF